MNAQEQTHRRETMNKHTMKSRTFGAMVAFAGTLGLTLAAQAGEPAAATNEKYADVVVEFGDLNLASDDGARVLYARLTAAAERACGSEPSVRELKQRMQYQACVDAKLERAVQKVGHKNVMTVHARHSDTSVG
jgi:UrcA family protein